MDLPTSDKGFIGILNWFKNNNFEFGDINQILLNASKYWDYQSVQINVLRWFSDNGFNIDLPLIMNQTVRIIY